MTDLNFADAFTWPAGHRAALCPIVLFDTPGDDRPDSQAIGRDYAPTGFDRLLGVLADLALTATVGVTQAAARFAPTLVAKAADQDLDVVPWLNASDDRDSVQSMLKRLSGEEPGGVITGLPDRPSTNADSDTGTWVIDGSGGDGPAPQGNTCLIPTSPYWIDAAWLDPLRPLPPSSLLEAWSLSLAAVRSQGALMTVIIHAHIGGRPGFSSQILRFLDEAIESGDVWIANAEQIATWWHQQSTGPALDHN